MVVSLIILCKLDGVVLVEVIHGGKLTAIRTHDRHVILDLIFQVIVHSHNW